MASRQEPELCDDCEYLPEKIQALLNAKMFRAVTAGHIECLKKAIAEGAKVNALDEPIRQRKKILDALSADDNFGCKVSDVIHDCDGDINDPPQKTALIHAVEASWLAGVELLIESRAKVNKDDTLGRTALMVAAEKGEAQLLEVLIQAGADVNREQDTEYDKISFMPKEKLQMLGCTALMYAAKSGNAQCVQLLLNAGADVNVVQKNEWKWEREDISRSAVDYAMKSGNKEVLNLLINAGADANTLGESVILLAKKGNDELLRYLIEMGADVNLREGEALVWAARHHHQCLRHLIDAGADVNLREGEALVWAARHHHQCLRHLIDAGADVNSRDGTYSALKWAVVNGKEMCVELLIEAGVDVNTCKLHYTSLKILWKLLRAGIEVNIIEGCREETALRYCIKNLRERSMFYNEDELEEVKEKIKILHAAGEILIKTPGADYSWSKPLELPDFLKDQTKELNLMSICGEFIREQMSKVNLFYRVPRLGLPDVLCQYLLYNVGEKEILEN